MLTGIKNDLVVEWNGNLVEKKDRICFKGIRGKTVNIPSSMYPLSGEMEIFSQYNTENLDDLRIEEIFNSVHYQIGKCYTNAENLYNALSENQVDGVECYEGWLLIGQNELPIHHAFVVIKKDGKNYVLDYAADMKADEADRLQAEYGKLPDDELRKVMLKTMKEKEKLPYSKKATFGKVDRMYLYVACECSPDRARENFQKLMKMYPDHPSYVGVDKRTGASKMQEMQLDNHYN